MTKMNKKFRITFSVIFLCALVLLLTSFLSDKKRMRQSIESGGVVLSFDDDFVEDWYDINRELQEYGWRATFFVSKFHTFEESEINKLKDLQSQGHEIALHGRNHANALEFTSENSLNEYIDTEILPSLNAMEQEGFDISSFAYPYGAKIRPDIYEKVKGFLFADYNDRMDYLLLEHFDILRGTTYGKEIPSQQKNYANGSQLVFGLGIDDSYNNDRKYLLSLLQHARKNDKIVIFYGHRILPETDSLRYVTNYKILEEICNYVNEHDMHFLTMRDLVID